MEEGRGMALPRFLLPLLFKPWFPPTLAALLASRSLSNSKRYALDFIASDIGATTTYTTATTAAANYALSRRRRL